MKKLVILGAGTAGTMMLNKLVPVLDPDEWQITIVDQEPRHYYQPGFLFIPFGIYRPEDVVKPKRNFFPAGAEAVFGRIEAIEPDRNRVVLEGGRILAYDWLILATGARIAPEETEGMLGEGWRRNVFDFYTLEGATALAGFLEDWEGGRLVINITEMPIKCPVAPLEFAFLADWWFTKRGIRNKVEIEFVTPLSHAFTKPVAARYLGDFLQQKNIKLTTDFSTGSIDAANNRIVSWDEKEVGYDLLVAVPTNKGDDCIERSGMGDELNFVPTHKHTLLSKNHPNIFVIGDATDLPASKAGSVAHFEADILLENFRRAIAGRPLKEEFDGHANCFIESGFGKGLLIDFNYDVEPLPGKFPLPGLGPMSLLQESRINHYAKLMFRWVYWNLLLRGAELPLEPQMSMCGKRRVA
ncbi:MAG: NAD(P)/FAD-dependent oxidoreductase [Verrucomicrobia bacterium]|nr:MAG: NAD(P)/FAD-dependent oxidoreductase [Verrucomicrobiota bacterium]